jgi:hypothetical protein
MEFKTVKIETFIPKEYINKLRDELNSIDALTVDGCYDYCMSVSMVKGSWRPLQGANPFNGEIGKICEAEEARVEFSCRMELYKAAVDAIKKVHPYEKAVINVIPLLDQ